MPHDTPSTLAEAAAWADRVRAARSDLVDRVASGEIDLTAAWTKACGSALTRDLWIVVLAEATPGAGKVATRRALRSMAIEDHDRMWDLTSAQVEDLQERLT